MARKFLLIALLAVSACAESHDDNAVGIVTENRVAPVQQAAPSVPVTNGAAMPKRAAERAVIVPPLPPELQDDGGLEPLPPRPTPEEIARHAADRK